VIGQVSDEQLLAISKSLAVFLGVL
jgi:hypothetical protein